MKKYLVIGNPIDHSLSPRLHNYWFKENNIDAAYEKKQIKENDIEGIISEMRNGKIDGINVTVPFKKSVIPFLDELDNLAKKTQSVNTIYKDKKQRIICLWRLSNRSKRKIFVFKNRRRRKYNYGFAN